MKRSPERCIGWSVFWILFVLLSLSIATATAQTYPEIPNQLYTLTVEKGSGGGDYTAGTTIGITADPAGEGKVFDQWEVKVGTPQIADIYASSTSLVMPAQNVKVKAKYKTAPIYQLIVDSGSGDGSYTAGKTIVITADPAAEGFIFDQWEVKLGTPQIADIYASSTSLVMPAQNATVQAIYKTAPKYQLIVDSGSGDGSYTAGRTISITADPAGEGKVFDKWEVKEGTPQIADIYASSTTLVMPAQNATVKAKYKGAPKYLLTVDSGSGDGNYAAGKTVSIAADPAAQGLVFDKWEVKAGTPQIADIYASSTSLVMPAQNVTVQATYKAALKYLLTVDGGSGDGSYAAGATIGITADPAGEGFIFDKWEVKEGTPQIADSYAPSTSLVMPAQNATVQAKYKAIKYQLIVDSGSGDGSYAAGKTIGITADPAGEGFVFSKWEVKAGTPQIADIYAASTTLVMPTQNVTVQATYKAVPKYQLIVDGGSGDGSYAAGASIGITADPAGAGQVFDKWEVILGTPQIADLYGSSTSLAMPAQNVTVKATYKAAPTYQLTVDSGSGDGTYFAGTTIGITADPASLGFIFDKWEVKAGTPQIADIYAPSTTLVMPAQDVTVKAKYKAIKYQLIVDSGSGDGNYTAGTRIAITADAAAEGLIFDRWEVNAGTPEIADFYAASTTLVMPTQNVTVQATYKVNPKHQLIVENGSGDGSYTAGTKITITANTAPEGQIFDRWVVDYGNPYIYDVVDPHTTLEMPGCDAKVKATFKINPKYLLTVENGSGDGNYTAGTKITITANTAPEGQIFDRWVVEYGNPYIYDVLDPHTTLEMPGCDAKVKATFKIKPKYLLIVDNGSGDGSYTAGTKITITANTAPEGQMFDRWVVDYGNPYIYDVLDPHTTLEMPECNTRVKAAYKDIPKYELIVDNGSPDGMYPADTVVYITANEAPKGQVFHYWKINYGNPVLDNIYEYSTTLRMPPNKTKISAVYVDGTQMTRTFQAEDYSADADCVVNADHLNYTGVGFVNMGGQGSWFEMPIDVDSSGIYRMSFYYALLDGQARPCEISVNGQVAGIVDFSPTADWDTWSSKTVDVSLTRGINTVRVFATTDAGGPNVDRIEWTMADYQLIVANGSPGGMYTPGSTVSITADEAPKGQVFHHWEINYGNPVLGDIYDYSTTLTMPPNDASVSAVYIDGTLSTRVFQAEDYSSVTDCTVATNHLNYTGWGFVDMGGKGSWFEMPIEVDSRGIYTVALHYALSGSKVRPCEIKVNGQVAGIVDFSPTHDWDTWTWKTVDVWLNRGINTVRVTATTDAGGPNMDRIEWTMSPDYRIDPSSLFVGEELHINGYLESPSGQYRFILKDDGNLVLMNWSTQVVLWASGSQGAQGTHLVLQGDSHLVLYTSAGDPVWWSGTVGSGAYVLKLNDAGKLALYKNNQVVWSKN